jgi:hypothetical protein
MSNTTAATIDGRMRDDEVTRRFPEVELIEDDEIREATISAIGRGVPEYFWEVPATSSGRYHNPFARRRHGLWIHVKMVFTVYERFVRSFVEQGLITEAEADAGRAAVLLHDMLKYGHGYDDGDGTETNHDKLAGHWLKHNSEVPEATVNAVKAHNGPWYDGPSPDHSRAPLEQLVHMADMAASTKNVTAGVYEPAEEIAEAYPNLPRADL